jgi:hypothetical protein
MWNRHVSAYICVWEREGRDRLDEKEKKEIRKKIDRERGGVNRERCM